jgi:hypothetical protein
MGWFPPTPLDEQGTLQRHFDETAKKLSFPIVSDPVNSSLALKLPFYWSVALKLDANHKVSLRVDPPNCAERFYCSNPNLSFGGFLIKKLHS